MMMFIEGSRKIEDMAAAEGGLAPGELSGATLLPLPEQAPSGRRGSKGSGSKARNK